ncbi:sigma-54 interaction domain-containing protein [Atopomonas sediminilitoris]|uniref:sigma-54 interaction domain-containing protein n=1 Tax=Atopomonas sediminilitoris TaxID=2919919 RepID=UPI001F4EE517|nr:sigma 54-interacting transcriptional regulator [Atopomonas sediminilitoris]MCJ8170452.1 sigma 54-interacting transcriptional regulator [Atopomonas sediminilitoris]
MIESMPRPALYAERLLSYYTALGKAPDVPNLLAELAVALARLTDSQLSQVYLLDDTHTQLQLSAQWLDGKRIAGGDSRFSADYADQQLLQYCLCQNRVLAIGDLFSSPYDTAFLPERSPAWRSLLCLPWQDARGRTQGVLLCAGRRSGSLAHFAESLQQLGGFALSQHQLLCRLRGPQSEHNRVRSLDYGLIGDSPAMRGVYQLLSKVLDNNVNVLLTGETGTGKELAARAIHDHGLRRNKPFIVQNCASLPESLLESELFGYRKGAFSGADRDREGLLDAANGGTLFLDEIGDMPLTLQAKLLRVLQEGEVRPLGSTQTHRVDVRIVAATHRDLLGMARLGQFREDLYYRLASFPIALPALRERADDILVLARHFADKACAFLTRDLCRWSPEALKSLRGYAFPGNVRELKGLVERAVLLCEGGELLPEHFNLGTSATTLPTLLADNGALSFRECMEQVERQLLLQSLRRNNGNQTHAAKELGLPRRTLLYRMERLRISSADV